MSVNTSAIPGCCSGIHASSCPDASYVLLGADDSVRSRTAPPLTTPSTNGESSTVAAAGGGGGAEEEENSMEDQFVHRRYIAQSVRGGETSRVLSYSEPSLYSHSIQRRAPHTTVMHVGRQLSGAPSENTPSRHAEVREMLVTAERELAEVREECVHRAVEIESLRVELAHERDVNQHSQTRYDNAMQELREEHAEQMQRLMEQVTLLKRLSEGTMDEKAKIVEDAAQRKQQLLALLEREREEKSQIMADYRQQTEALIAEQGREITTLRNTLQSLREGQEQSLTERQELEEKLEAMKTKVTEIEGMLVRERSEMEKCLQDAEHRNTQHIKELLAQNEELTVNTERETARQQERRQELEDQVRTLGERLRLQEESHAMKYQTLKDAHGRELDRLREELQAALIQREQLEEECEKTRQRSLKNEEKITQSLHHAVDQIRQEKEAVTEEASRLREELQEKHWAKMNQMQSVIENLRRQLAEEGVARKDAESERDLVTVRADSLQTTVDRLNTEIEALQVEYRSRERAAVQERQNNLEQLRVQLRERGEEVEALQKKILQRDFEEQRLRDEVNTKAQAFQNLLAENKRIQGEMQQVANEKEREMVRREVALEKNATILRTQKTQVEAECQRLQQAMAESAARQQACERQLEEESSALESAMVQVRELRDVVEEQKSAQRRAQSRQQELEEELRRRSNEIAAAGERIVALESSLEAALGDTAQQSKEIEHLAKSQELELQSLKQKQDAEAAALRFAADELRCDLTKAREAAAAKEEELQRLREEVNQLHRDVLMRAGSWQDELADAKEVHEDDVRRMDEVLYALRNDLSRAQAAKVQCQKDMSQVRREAERQRVYLEDMLSQVEIAKEKLQEDAKYREQLNNELQGTVRLLSSRLAAHEDDMRRLQEELAEANTKLQDAHSFLGRKDAAIGHLNARLRAYEARMGSSAF